MKKKNTFYTGKCRILWKFYVLQLNMEDFFKVNAGGFSISFLILDAYIKSSSSSFLQVINGALFGLVL